MWLWVGDAVYYNKTKFLGPPVPSAVPGMFRQQNARADYREAVQAAVVDGVCGGQVYGEVHTKQPSHIWRQVYDDHDYGLNDAGIEYPHKAHPHQPSDPVHSAQCPASGAQPG